MKRIWRRFVESADAGLVHWCIGCEVGQRIGRAGGCETEQESARPLCKAVPKQSVTVCEQLAGRVRLFAGDRELAYMAHRAQNRSRTSSESRNVAGRRSRIKGVNHRPSIPGDEAAANRLGVAFLLATTGDISNGL